MANINIDAARTELWDLMVSIHHERRAHKTLAASMTNVDSGGRFARMWRDVWQRYHESPPTSRAVKRFFTKKWKGLTWNKRSLATSATGSALGAVAGLFIPGANVIGQAMSQLAS